MARLESPNFKFNIEIKIIDSKQENYNLICAIDLCSDVFYGKTEITTSITDVKTFINELKNMYNFLKGCTKLTDYDYGSFINIICDEFGYFVFDGIIVNGTSNELHFKNRIDQTYIKNFINVFSAEFEKALEND